MSDVLKRFGAIERLYGGGSLDILGRAHVLVVGTGGVGSWVAEALARSGVGRITLIDGDVIDIGNINRQLPALTDTLGRPKVEVLAGRISQINPACVCRPVGEYLNMANMEGHLGAGYDYVVDALDSIKFKVEMINYCKRNKLPIITTGGAGGLTDPGAVKVADVSKSHNDPLMAKVRSRLRSEYGFSRNAKRRFGIECVFSSQQQVYPKPDGSVGHEKPGIHGVSLDCRYGYGSATFVTGVFGFTAAARVVNRLLGKK